MRDNKSVGTLDCSDMSSFYSGATSVASASVAGSISSPGVEQRDGHGDVAAGGDLFRSFVDRDEEERSKVEDAACGVKTNPFDDEDGDEEESLPPKDMPPPKLDNTVYQAKSISTPIKTKAYKRTNNPYGVTPDPFDDSSIDSSFIGTVTSSNHDDTSTARSPCGEYSTYPERDNQGDESVTSTSVDGDLFQEFQSVLHPKKHSSPTKILESQFADRNLILNKSGTMKKTIQNGSTMSQDGSSSGEFSIDSIRQEAAYCESVKIKVDGGEEIKSIAQMDQKSCDNSVNNMNPRTKEVHSTTNPFDDNFDFSNGDASFVESPENTNPFNDDDSQEFDADEPTIDKKNLVSNPVREKEDASVNSDSMASASTATPMLAGQRRVLGDESINSATSSVDGVLFQSFLHRKKNKIKPLGDDSSEIQCGNTAEQFNQPTSKVMQSKSRTNPFGDSFNPPNVASSSVVSCAKTGSFYDDSSEELDADDSTEKRSDIKPIQPKLYDSNDESPKKTNPFYDTDSQEFDADESMDELTVSVPVFKKDVGGSSDHPKSSSLSKSSNPFDMEKSSQEFDAVGSMKKEAALKSAPSYNSVDSSSIITHKPVEKSSNQFDLDESSRQFDEDKSTQEKMHSTEAQVGNSEFNNFSRTVTPSPKKWSMESTSIESSRMQSSSKSAFQEAAPKRSTMATKNPFVADATPTEAAHTAKKWQMGADSFDSSVDSSSDSLLVKKEIKSTNPFADILAIRAKERKANHWIAQQMMNRNSDISQIELESSSQEDNDSEVSPTVDQGTVVIEDTDRIKVNLFGESIISCTDLESDSEGSSSEDSSDDSSESASLGGTIFTDVRKALSNIQSVSYETNEEESEVAANSVGSDEDKVGVEKEVVDDSSNKPDFNVSQSEAFNAYSDESSSLLYMAPLQHVSTDSCAVSSLKTTDFKAAHAPGLDVNESFDNEEDASIPKCPTSFESTYNIGVVESWKKNDVTEKQDTTDTRNTKVKHHPKEKKSKRVPRSDRYKSPKTHEEALLRSGPILDSVTAGSIERLVNILPPKKHVVLPDGSISTKDSIVGRTIRVTNADMVAERIYLESLRAQVHAELKVHVADEEIRLALEGRLNAIRDFYERKTTTVHLKCSQGNVNIAENALFSSNPKCASKPGRPKILQDGSIAPASPKSAMTDVSSLSCPKEATTKGSPAAVNETIDSNIKLSSLTKCPSVTSSSKGARMNSLTPNDQKIAYGKAEENIHDALKAANLSTSSYHDFKDNKGQNEESKEEGEIIDKSTCHITAPANNLYPNKAFRDDCSHHDDLIVSTSHGAKSEVASTVPAVKDAWIFYRQINNLMSDSRVYDYEFESIQKDPLYPYLNSLTGIADSGDDGLSSADKKVKQRMREEFKNKSPHRICHILAKEAKGIQPELIEVCEDIARKLNMRTMAVGKYIACLYFLICMITGID